MREREGKRDRCEGERMEERNCETRTIIYGKNKEWKGRI